MSDTHGTYKFGSSGGNYKKKNYFSLKEGEKRLFRVLPPFKSGVKTGSIAQYWAIFWLTDSAGRKRPVASIQRKKGKEILVRDPLVDKIEGLRMSLDHMIANKENPVVIEKVRETVRSYDLDKGYHLNVMTPTGEIGVLKLRYTAYEDLRMRLGELDAKGIDAINVGPTNGIFFEFKRFKNEQGKTVYKVDPAMTSSRNPETGRPVIDYSYAPIDENVLRRMESEAFDLSSMYKTLTPEEMGLLATLDPAMVDRVLSRPDKVEDEDGDEELDLPTTFKSAPTSYSSAPAPTWQAPVQAAAPTLTTSTNNSVTSDYAGLPPDVKQRLFGR